MNHTGCYVLATHDGHGMFESDPEEQEDGCQDFWEKNVEFYALVVAFYKANPDVDTCDHEKDGAADSESDDGE